MPPNLRLGRYATTTFGGESVRAFIPPPLPPKPPLKMKKLQILLELANQSLGRLDGSAALLPDVGLFLYAYVRKEAVLSSQIEGTQSSLSDLLLFENSEVPGVPLHDVQEVSNYVAALSHGMRRLKGGFPVSLRLIREIHEVLLAKGRGSNMQPGDFRTSQNWIGGSRPANAAFVPPPPSEVMPCMGQLERFLHDDRTHMPLLIKAALAHVQFETIHPFLDGNGRVGRLLITFLLHAGEALREPILYLSLYFKEHRETYYELLNRVRETGDWETWLEFFLTAVKETADKAVGTTRRMLTLFEDDRRKIETLGRPAASALRVFQFAQTSPMFAIAATSVKLGVSFPTVAKSVDHLKQIGILQEITGKQSRRLFLYKSYLSILSEGTEPLRMTAS